VNLNYKKLEFNEPYERHTSIYVIVIILVNFFKYLLQFSNPVLRQKINMYKYMKLQILQMK